MTSYGWNPWYWQLTDWVYFFTAITLVGPLLYAIATDAYPDYWIRSQWSRMKITSSKLLDEHNILLTLKGPLGHRRVVVNNYSSYDADTLSDVPHNKKFASRAIAMTKNGLIGSPPEALDQLRGKA